MIGMLFRHLAVVVIVVQKLRTSPLKPRGQSKPCFMCSIRKRGGNESMYNGSGHMTKMDSRAINSFKNIWKLPVDRFHRNLVRSIGDSNIIKNIVG